MPPKPLKRLRIPLLEPTPAPPDVKLGMMPPPPETPPIPAEEPDTAPALVFEVPNQSESSNSTK